MIGREDEVREYRVRSRIFFGLVICMFCVLVSRLVYLQLLKGEELRKFSEANRLKKEKLTPPRGILYDRDGTILVDNRAAFDVVLLSQYYPFTEKMNRRLAKALNMSLPELERRLAKVDRSPSFLPVLIKGDASKDVVAAIEMDSEGFPGVDIEASVQRRYPFGDLSSQVLGYIGEVGPGDIKANPNTLTKGDYNGKMGIERKYDGYLRGVNGWGYVEVDAMGRRKKAEGAEGVLGYVAQSEAVAGNNLQLTLDADLSQVARESMRSRKFSGTVVALDPRSGEVLAMINEPTYDSGVISSREIDPKVWAALRNNPDRPLRNRAIQDHYPPGSTFKLFLAIAGMAEGLVTTHSSVNCPGYWLFGNRKFNCWQHHGTIDFIHAIKQSCDVFFYKLGNDLGIDLIAKWSRYFGLGAPTGISIPGEARGNIPDGAWKKKVFNDPWRPGDTVSVAIGQGYVDVTPLQLVTAYAAIANGGFVYRPYIVKRISTRSGEVLKEFKPELVRKIDVPTEVITAVKEGLYKVLNEPGGTAFLSKSKLTSLSGKTGTAQVKTFSDISKVKNCSALPYRERHHAWFVGYAPKDNPEIAVVTIAEHGCHGYAAAHVVQEVVDAYILKKAKATTPLAEKTDGVTPITAGVDSTVTSLVNKATSVIPKRELTQKKPSAVEDMPDELPRPAEDLENKSQAKSKPSDSLPLPAEPESEIAP